MRRPFAGDLDTGRAEGHGEDFPWMMRDANAPAYNHGSGEVAYGGKGGIACGALSNYEGPSPPPGQQHLYRIYLKALDASGAQLAGATAERKFPEP